MAYATMGDLEAFIGAIPREGADRMLERASTLIDACLKTAVYATDGSGNPTDAALLAALRDAACAQVEWWLVIDDEFGGKASGATGTFVATDPRLRLGPRAADILATAGFARAIFV